MLQEVPLCVRAYKDVFTVYYLRYSFVLMFLCLIQYHILWKGTHTNNKPKAFSVVCVTSIQGLYMVYYICGVINIYIRYT